jgi:glycosyltransferase involved in cell wall biosynthesis
MIFFHPSTSVTALGGAEKRFVETLKFFCTRNNFKITVLESAPTILSKPGITCRKLAVAPGFQGKGWLSNYAAWISWAVKACFRSFSLVQKENLKLILVPNNTLPNLFAGYTASRLSRLPFYAVVHHVDTPFIKKKGEKGYSLFNSYRSIGYDRRVSIAKTLASYIALYVLKRAKGIITVSNFTATILENSSISRERIFISGNAIENNFINHVKPYAAQRIYDGVFVGRIAREKGLFDLLKAWKKVAEDKPYARLLIIGSGLELTEVEEKVIAYRLEKSVIIRGGCPEEELYGLLKASRVFIFPSLFEGWGIAVAEALACGLPVVAYDIPALREIFGRCESVFLVPPRDTEAIARTALRILSRKDEKLQQFSIDYAKNFDWNKVAAADLEIIEKIEKGRG